MSDLKSQWLAVDEDRGVLCLFRFGLARGFMSAHSRKLGLPLGFDTETEAREMIDMLAEDPLIDPASFNYFEVHPKNGIPSPDEMEAAGVEARFAEIFRGAEPEPSLDPVFAP
ncbi:hypothetical protein ACVIGB_000432 [Bradyrhizobium sp. USDA 4341]